MKLVDAPEKLVLPFAADGGKNSIPVDSQIGIVAGAASLTDGFPPLTRTPLSAGGVPPSGLDANGILYEMSAIDRWINSGAGYIYDSDFANDSNVGGYPKGALVLRSDAIGYWLNTVDDNVADPEAAGSAAAGWVPGYTNGIAAITMASTNVTLTPLQYGQPIIVISGTLTTNLNLVFPNIKGMWAVVNNASGAFSVTCKTAAGTGVSIATGSRRSVYCNATNVLSSDSLREELAASSGASLIGFIQSGSGAVARTVQGKERETISVLDFGAIGDGVDDTAAFTAAAATGQPYYVPYTANFYALNSNPTGKAYGPGTIKVSGQYFVIPLAPNMTGAVLMGRNNNVEGQWFVVAPDGTLIDTTGTTTQGLQEGLNYASLNGFNFKAEVGGINPTTGGIDYATITCANNLNPVLQIPRFNQASFDIGTATLILAPVTASNDGIWFDTFDMANFKCPGQTLYKYPGSGTGGTAVKLIPINDNGETFIGGTSSTIEFGTIAMTNSAGAIQTTQGTGYRISAANGDIIHNTFKLGEVNGGLVGFQIDNPSGSFTVRENTFELPAVHGQSSAGINIGTSSTTLIKGNKWKVTSTPLTGVALSTYAVKDTYEAAIGGGTTGIQQGTSASNNLFIAPYNLAATAIVDNSTAKDSTFFQGDSFIKNTSGTVAAQLLFGGASTGITTSISSINWSKDANGIVSYVATIRLTSKGSATGTMSVTGLPFTSLNLSDTSFVSSMSVNNMAATVTSACFGAVAPNSSAITASFVVTGTSTSLTDVHFTNTSVIRIQGFYPTV